MISKLKNVLIAVAAMFALATPALVPSTVFANNITDGLCTGVDVTTGSGQFNGGSPSACSATDASQANTAVRNLITRIINIISLIVGVVAVIMIVFGGFKYITSGGESSNISGAKNTIIYALVGLIIVALAQFIVHFVLGNVTNIAQ